MQEYTDVLLIAGAILALVAMIWGILRLYRKVGPATAMIISGRSKEPRFIVGSGAFVFPVLHTVNFLSLENRTITVEVRNVYTSTAVPVNVTVVAQVKVSEEEARLRAAASRFSTQTREAIEKTLGETLAGHVRAIISTMTPEAVYNDRGKFSAEVVELSGTELGNLGFDIDSCVIQEVGDDNNFFNNLAQPRIVAVKRDAEIATAIAERETRQERAAAMQAAEGAENEAKAAIGETERDRDIRLAQYRAESEKARADAEVAGPLQTATRQRDVAEQEGQIEVVRQQQAALAAEVEITVAERRERANRVIPAQMARLATVEKAAGEAEALKATAGAEAEQTRVTRLAEAEGNRAIGQAEAEVIRQKLLAEAEGEAQLAEARASENEVNFRRDALQIFADAKVEIGKAVAAGVAGLGKDMRVVQFSGGNNGNGGVGNALLNAVSGLPGMIAQADAAGDALFGFSVMDILTGKWGKNGHNGTSQDEPTAEDVLRKPEETPVSDVAPSGVTPPTEESEPSYKK